MEKDFDGWNEEKKQTETEVARLYTVCEIWGCQLGVNIGSEQDGKGTRFLRPCIIVREFGADACLAVPLTTSPKEHRLRMSIGVVQKKEAKANLSQMRIVDTRRLVEKVGFLNKDMFDELKRRIKELF